MSPSPDASSLQPSRSSLATRYNAHSGMKTRAVIVSHTASSCSIFGRSPNDLSVFVEHSRRETHRFLDVRVTVRRRYEARFERRRREIHARVEHRVEEPVEAIAVGRHHGLERVGWPRGEIDAEHPADRLR